MIAGLLVRLLYLILPGSRLARTTHPQRYGQGAPIAWRTQVVLSALTRRLPVGIRVARYAADVAHSSDLEARVAALEARLEEVAADAAAARHLAAARDRDLAEFAVRLEANRKAINALGEQTAAWFDHLGGRWTKGSPRYAASWTPPQPGSSRSSPC